MMKNPYKKVSLIIGHSEKTIRQWEKRYSGGEHYLRDRKRKVATTGGQHFPLDIELRMSTTFLQKL